MPWAWSRPRLPGALGISHGKRPVLPGWMSCRRTTTATFRALIESSAIQLPPEERSRTYIAALHQGAVVLVLETKAGGGTRLMAQRLYAPLFSYGSFETALIRETDENVEILAAAANELGKSRVLLRTDNPLHPARLISLQVAPPVIGSLLLENGSLRAETTQETGWRYLMEESRDLSSWRLCCSFAPGGGQGTWIQGLAYPATFSGRDHE